MARFGKLILIGLAAFIGIVVFIGMRDKFDDNDIPVGCQQYIQAEEACISAWHDNLERIDASKVDQADKLLNNLNALRADIRNRVKTQGEQAAAQYCTSPEFTDKQGGSVANLATTLVMTGGMSEDCRDKFSQIRIAH
jgi:hypothetical protein